MEDTSRNAALLDRAGGVRRGETIDSARLLTFLETRIPNLGGEITIRQYPSGYSNLTYLVESRDRSLVLRRPPIGAQVKKGHDMGREYRVLKAVHSAFPRCPAPLVYCEDPEVIGAPFLVMEKMTGLILRKDLPQGLTLSPLEARHLCESMVSTLVDIHAVDVEGQGLDFIGRPRGYVQRQVTGWCERYRRARTPDAPDCEAAMAWLTENMPPDTESPTLVHNDYKFDNLVLDPAAPQSITGVLDWEMTTWGDPLMDLGNSLAYWVQADDPPEIQAMRTLPTHLPGMMTRAEVLAAYEAASGRSTRDFDFYYGFGLFRLAVIAQQIYYRFYHKITDNPRFGALIFGVLGLEQTLNRLMESSKK